MAKNSEMEISRCVLANLSACVPEEDGADFEFALGFGAGFVRLVAFRTGLADEREAFLELFRFADAVFFLLFLAADLAVLLPALDEAENANAICAVDDRFFLAILLFDISIIATVENGAKSQSAQ